MKNIRVWFRKTDTAKYISHLDLSRCMERAIHKAKLPFWYTEGFNPHVFLTITMPISLGFTGMKESMDVKLLNDDMPYQEIIDKLNSGLPKNVRVYNITEPVMRPGAIAFSEYEILVRTKNTALVSSRFLELLSDESIMVNKKTKKGIVEVDIKEDFKNMTIEPVGPSILKIHVILKSSNSGSTNPRLIFEAYISKYGEELYPEITRINCFDINMNEYM